MEFYFILLMERKSAENIREKTNIQAIFQLAT